MSERHFWTPPNRCPGRLVSMSRYSTEEMRYDHLLAWPAFCPQDGPVGELFTLFPSTATVGLVLADVRYATREYSLVLAADRMGWLPHEQVEAVTDA